MAGLACPCPQCAQGRGKSSQVAARMKGTKWLGAQGQPGPQPGLSGSSQGPGADRGGGTRGRGWGVCVGGGDLDPVAPGPRAGAGEACHPLPLR